MNILAPKIRNLYVGLRIQSSKLENGFQWFWLILVVYGDYISKWNLIGGIFKKVTVCILGTQMRDVDFFQIQFYCSDRFHCCSVLVTISGLPSNSWFHFRGNIIRVSLIGESMCNVFAQVFFYLLLLLLLYQDVCIKNTRLSLASPAGRWKNWSLSKNKMEDNAGSGCPLCEWYCGECSRTWFRTCLQM
jgi:hypothetical protein